GRNVIFCFNAGPRAVPYGSRIRARRVPVRRDRTTVERDDAVAAKPVVGVTGRGARLPCPSRALASAAAPAQDSSHCRARWCRSGRASSNRTSMAGLPSWRMVNLAPSPAMYTGECLGAWAQASFIAPAIVRSLPSDVEVGQSISNAILSTFLIFHDR